MEYWNPLRAKTLYRHHRTARINVRYSLAEGYKGLLTGKKAITIYARGGAYGPGTGAEAYDLQTKALGRILDFIGIADVTPISVKPTLAALEQVEAALANAKMGNVRL